MRLVRVVGPHFVAAFETDGTVRRAAPILKALIGMSDDDARAHIAAQGWHASLVDHPVRVIQHWESFEVQRDGKRTMFYYDTNAFRRGVSGRVDRDTARQQALAFAGVTADAIEIDPEQAGPPPWKE